MEISFKVSRNKPVEKAYSFNTTNVTSWQNIKNLFWTTLNFNKSRKKLIDEAWGCNPYAHMVISRIAQTISRLDYEFVKNDKPVQSGLFYDLMQRPNKEQYQSEFIEAGITELQNNGECFIHFVKSVGFSSPVEMRILQAQFVDVFSSDNKEIKYITFNRTGEIETIYPQDYLHIKFYNPIDNDIDQLRGYSPLKILDRVTSASNSNFVAEAAILENRGIQGFISSGTDEPTLDGDKTLLQNSFNKRHSGSAKFGEIAVTKSNLKYTAVGANPADLQMLDSNIAKLRVICAFFGLDSKLFGDSASSTYNNMTEAKKAAYTEVYLPLANFFIDQLNKYFQEVYKATEIMKIDTSKIEVLKEINKDFSDKIVKEVAAGILSPQQALELIYPNLVFDAENVKPLFIQPTTNAKEE